LTGLTAAVMDRIGGIVLSEAVDDEKLGYLMGCKGKVKELQVLLR